MDTRDNNIQAVEQSRSNISYRMSDRDLQRQQTMKVQFEKEEQDRIHRLNQQDNQAFNVYEQIHNRLINK